MLIWYCVNFCYCVPYLTLLSKTSSSYLFCPMSFFFWPLISSYSCLCPSFLFLPPPRPLPCLASSISYTIFYPFAFFAVILSGVEVVVEYEYDALHDDELTLRLGDIIKNVRYIEEDGWMEGDLNGKRGLFPDNFVKVRSNWFSSCSFYFGGLKCCCLLLWLEILLLKLWGHNRLQLRVFITGSEWMWSHWFLRLGCTHMSQSCILRYSFLEFWIQKKKIE